MTREDIIETFEELARSQGSYERLLNSLKDAKDNDPVAYEDFLEELEAQNFSDPVDLILYIEG